MCICPKQSIKTEKQKQKTRMTFEERNEFELPLPMQVFLATEDAQNFDGEHVETGNGNQVCIVIEQYVGSS